MANPESANTAGVTRSTRRLDRDLLTSAEIEALLGACSSRASTGIRNRAIIALAWRSGLRIGEILALHLKDIDTAAGTVTVQHGKGDKHRVVGMDAGTAALVERWLATRGKLGLSRKPLLFSTLRGSPIDQSYIRHLLPRLAMKCGIVKRTHAHGLRHAFASDLEREGAPLSHIRDLLGHSTAAITDSYLRRVGAGDAIRFASNRSWPGEDESES